MIILYTIFIKESDDIYFKDKLLVIIKKIFKKIVIIDNKNSKIYILPITKSTKYNKGLINRLTRRIIRYLKYDKSNYVVLSKQLKNVDIIKNNLYSQDINILDGRYLFKTLSIRVIEYILKLKNNKIENSEIFVLINNYNNINERLIIELARRIKTLNIITDKIDNFKRIEKYLYREFGIILNISNNKKASLLKANIILNLDFTNEIINEYKIYNNAIIINILGNVIIKSKKFSGININYFNINIPDKYRINGFKNEEIYESIIYNLSYEKALEKLKQDNVKIKNLVGNRGIINKQEFLK